MHTFLQILLFFFRKLSSAELSDCLSVYYRALSDAVPGIALAGNRIICLHLDAPRDRREPLPRNDRLAQGRQGAAHDVRLREGH